MLTGKTRIQLLRQLHSHPGEGVTALGERVRIGHAAASQELRRIQSRGLLQVERQKSFVIYRMVADPQVPSAPSLLNAIQAALVHLPPERDEDMCIIASGLSHERRIRLVRTLLQEPRFLSDLPFIVGIPLHPFQAHMQTLLASGFVVKAGDLVRFEVPNHPLAKALAKLLRQGATR